MIERRALPGFLACLGGLLFCVAALAFDQGWMVLGAAVCTMFAAYATLGLADRAKRLRRQTEGAKARAVRATAESDRMAARAARFEAEAIVARNNLAEAMRKGAPAGGATATETMIVDGETGLFNQRFFEATLNKRVSAARRGLRPLAVSMIQVVDRHAQPGPKPSAPATVAGCLLETLRDADTACRLDDGSFAVLLEDTPENGAVWTIERVRRKLTAELPEATMWAGLACYPAHAFDTTELVAQASAALQSAREWRQDRIEVALAPDE